MKKSLLFTAMFMASGLAVATVPITGNVESKCVITTDTAGIYGNPVANLLSTKVTDGGAAPIIRYDIITPNTYKAVITTPVDFSDSPELNDTLAWDGDITTSEVSDASMSAFDTNKRVYNNMTEIDLTVSGTAWFKAESSVSYGYDKAFPAGNYSSVVVAECVAL